MLAEVTQRISARVRLKGSPSPRSQLRSRLTDYKLALDRRYGLFERLKSHLHTRPALDQPGQIRGVHQAELGIPAHGRPVAQDNDRLAIARYLNRSHQHRLADDLDPRRFERRSAQPITRPVALGRHGPLLR